MTGGVFGLAITRGSKDDSKCLTFLKISAIINTSKPFYRFPKDISMFYRAISKYQLNASKCVEEINV